MMGGTRFVGRPLVGHLLRSGHQVCLFTRGTVSYTHLTLPTTPYV